MRFNAARQSIGARAHVEQRKGTASEAWEYCKKEGDFESFNDPAGNPGSRSDLSSAADAIRGGASLKDVASESPSVFIRYHRGLERFRQLYEPRERGGRVRVCWLWGPTGTGKTRLACDVCPSAYIKPPGKWWDFYDGADTVILDDLRSDDFSFNFLLRLFDRYPLIVENKGGSFYMVAHKFIVTSPFSVEMMFPNHPEDIDQLQRRVGMQEKLLDYDKVKDDLEQFLFEE